QVLNRAGYSVEVAQAYEELTMEGLIQEDGHIAISLVLLDIAGFDAKIWQSCRAFSQRAIPLFIITPPTSAHLPTHHAPQVPLLVKPLVIHNLLTLIARTLLVADE
ncbi:MAG: hypothetical protein AAFW75_30170, partial [Cyanobacteria bacterium J06636_16]